MSRKAQAATIANNQNAVDEGDCLIPLHSVSEGKPERQRARVEPSTADAVGPETHALLNELKSTTGVLLRLKESVDALAEAIDELGSVIEETKMPGSDNRRDSGLVDAIPELKSIPAGRQRLLARIMLLAFMTIGREGEHLLVDPDKFLERLEEDNLYVEADDHLLLIGVPQ